MATLKFVNVNKVYPNNVQAVFDFNLEVANKDFIVFVGPSGCGKSTTLRMLAGLEVITDGEIYIDDVLINETPPKDRDIAMVFQNYALYPHMTVFDNMAFSLKLRKEHFPVYEVDDENPEYKRRYDEMYAALEKETEEGLARIREKNSHKTHKKTLKTRIQEFMFSQDSKLESEIIKLNLEFSKQVMTYDINKVKELSQKLSHLKKGSKEYLELLKKIEQVKETKNIPYTVYRHYNHHEISEKVYNAAATLGLTQYLKRKPAALSGGQRQRVALGRAIVRSPKVFLMDEPLSNLDAKLRVQMRSEIIKIHKAVGATTIYVTHDQTEAMTMATRIVCMKDGYIQQIGTPKELFNTPANMFVASFIGAPAMNLIHGHFDGKTFFAEGTDFKVSLTKEWISNLSNYVDKDIVLGVRPEDIYLKGDSSIKNPSNEVTLKCDISELLGRELIVYNLVGEQQFIVKTSSRDDILTDDVVEYVLDLDRIHFFNPETTNRI